MKAFVLLSCQLGLHPTKILKAQQVNALWTLLFMERSASLTVQCPVFQRLKMHKFTRPYHMQKPDPVCHISHRPQQAPFIHPPAFLPRRPPIIPRARPSPRPQIPKIQSVSLTPHPAPSSAPNASTQPHSHPKTSPHNSAHSFPPFYLKSRSIYLS